LKKYQKVYPEENIDQTHMKTFYFTLSLEYERCKRLYSPGINTVVMIDDMDKRIQLPVKNLRPHVTHLGLQGRFCLIIDNNNKLKSFEKIT
jgi:hypothetical protein